MQKEIEMPIGNNAAIIKQKVGRYHVGTRPLQVVRDIYFSIEPKTRKKIPRPLRRGLVKMILETHEENLKLYAAVMGGRL